MQPPPAHTHRKSEVAASRLRAPPSLPLGSLPAPPKILEEQPELFFHLQQQRLIELVRAGEVEQALEFAQEHLAPCGEENPAFLEELGEAARRACCACYARCAASLGRGGGAAGADLGTRAGGTAGPPRRAVPRRAARASLQSARWRCWCLRT